MTFIGAASAFKDQIHIGVDFFVKMFPPKYQRHAYRVDIVLITLFSALSTVIGYLWTIDIWGTLSPALELPIALALYAAFPTGSIIICVHGIRKLVSKNTMQRIEEEGLL
jgi:C4-dicarboxylate transporter DctQ subunit